MSLYLQLWFETCHVSFPLPSLPPPFSSSPSPPPLSIPPQLPTPPLPLPIPHPLLCSFPLLYPLLAAFPSLPQEKGEPSKRPRGCPVPQHQRTWQPASAPLENHPPQSFPVVEVPCLPHRLGNQTRGLCPGWVCSVDRKEASSFYSHHLAACPGKFSSRLSYHRRKTSRRSH